MVLSRLASMLARMISKAVLQEVLQVLKVLQVLQPELLNTALHAAPVSMPANDPNSPRTIKFAIHVTHRP